MVEVAADTVEVAADTGVVEAADIARAETAQPMRGSRQAAVGSPRLAEAIVSLQDLFRSWHGTMQNPPVLGRRTVFCRFRASAAPPRWLGGGRESTV